MMLRWRPRLKKLLPLPQLVTNQDIVAVVAR